MSPFIRIGNALFRIDSIVRVTPRRRESMFREKGNFVACSTVETTGGLFQYDDVRTVEDWERILANGDSSIQFFKEHHDKVKAELEDIRERCELREKERDELRTQIDAWHKAFEKAQLSHAIARLEAAEAKACVTEDLRFYKEECHVDENEVIYFTIRRKGYPEYTWPDKAMTEETSNEVVAKLNHDHGYTP